LPKLYGNSHKGKDYSRQGQEVGKEDHEEPACPAGGANVILMPIFKTLYSLPLMLQKIN
jgi:hypothetical protein